MVADVGSLIGDPTIHAVGGGSVTLGGLIWWIKTFIGKRIDALEPRVEQTEKEYLLSQKNLAEQRAFIAENYVKNDVLDRINSSFDRVHTRIDDMGAKTDKILQILVEKK